LIQANANHSKHQQSCGDPFFLGYNSLREIFQHKYQQIRLTAIIYHDLAASKKAGR
jgi:hypothetical protein